MRLIDADKLTELCDIMAEKCDDIGEVVWHQFRTTVEWSPTVDAEPVVRCKDCKRWKTGYFWNGTERKVCVIEPYEPCREPNDYCSRGERKDGAE